MLDQRRRRWADVVQMLYKYFAFVGHRTKGKPLTFFVTHAFTKPHDFSCVFTLGTGVRLPYTDSIFTEYLHLNRKTSFSRPLMITIIMIQICVPTKHKYSQCPHSLTNIKPALNQRRPRSPTTYAPSTRHWPNLVLMLGLRRRRWTNIEKISQCLAFSPVAY